MRILCLHGMGTSSKVFSMQTAALRSELASHNFEFVEGGLDCPAASGVAELFPTSTQFSAYYHPREAESILAAINDLSAYIASDGPFDGVMGFSQGAALGAMLIARHPSAAPFSFAIFLCAADAFCERSLKIGVLRVLNPEEDGVVIDIPTAHVMGAKDSEAGASKRVAGLCKNGGKKRVFEHQAGHEIPVAPKGITGDMARCVEAVILKAVLVQ